MNGFVKDFTDIFHLERYEDEIKSMDGYGEKSYQNLQASIQNARVTTLPRLVYSLGIPNIGIANARMICQALGNDPERVADATEEELDEIQGVGNILQTGNTGRYSAGFLKKWRSRRRKHHQEDRVSAESIL